MGRKGSVPNQHLELVHKWSQPPPTANSITKKTRGLNFYAPAALELTKQVIYMLVVDKMPLDLASRRGLRALL